MDAIITLILRACVDNCSAEVDGPRLIEVTYQLKKAAYRGLVPFDITVFILVPPI